MIPNFDHLLDKYADVIVRVGLNLQPDQRLLIGVPMLGLFGTPLELAPLVRLVTAKAYQAGARLVDVMWSDPELQRIRYRPLPATRGRNNRRQTPLFIGLATPTHQHCLHPS